MTKKRPFLKWAGGKYNCLEKILASLPQGQRLLEPFVGSGTVFINTHYPEYLLGERNQDLIHLYTTLQQEGEDFIEYCDSFFKPQWNNETTYYQFREEFNHLDYSPRRAALFIYLNKHGFNGLCRYNSKGQFNVPFGDNKPQLIRKNIQHFYNKAQTACFMHADFRELFACAKVGDVIYCDPPYVPLLENQQTIKYTSELFTLKDQTELANLAKKTAARGIPVLISNHDTPFTREHYAQADILSFRVSRTINCQSMERNPVWELLAVFR